MSITRDNGLSPADRAYADQVAAFCDEWDTELITTLAQSEELIRRLDEASAANDAQAIIRVSLDMRDAEHQAALRRTHMLTTAVALLREAML